MYLVSKCLLGENCKYNGGNNRNAEVLEFYSRHKCFEVCPEQLSGLPTPRPPAEYVGKRIIDKTGADVTEAFLRGTNLSFEAAVKAAENAGEKIDGAVLKANSPSCGSNFIYDGNFNGNLVEGDGCFASLLKEKGIKVISEKEIHDGKF